MRRDRLEAVSVLLVTTFGQVWLARRSPDAKTLPDLWETGGGKIDPGELPHEAAYREIMEEAGLKIRLDDLDRFTKVGEFEFRNPLVNCDVRMHAFRYLLNGAVPVNLEPTKRSEWRLLSVPSALNVDGGLTPTTKILLMIEHFNQTGKVC